MPGEVAVLQADSQRLKLQHKYGMYISVLGPVRVDLFPPSMETSADIEGMYVAVLQTIECGLRIIAISADEVNVRVVLDIGSPGESVMPS